MKLKQRLWLSLGIVAGALGGVAAARAYAKARRDCPPFRKRTYRDGHDLVAEFGALWRHPERLAPIVNGNGLDRHFAERLMLAVTGVNGCRYCKQAHAWKAMRDGMPSQEVAALLDGELPEVSANEAPALAFAQHYADTGGLPEGAVFERLVSTYGAESTAQILTHIRIITLCNLAGNTFDALLSRFLGQPAEGSTLRGELAALIVFAFGILPLSPLLVARAQWASLQAAEQG